MNQASDHLNRRILVIDDDRAIHEDFRKILSTRSDGGVAYEEMRADFFGDGTPGESVGRLKCGH